MAKKPTTVKSPKVTAKAPGYNAIRNRNRGRDYPTVERKSEDEMLTNVQRLLLVSGQRDDFRNTTISPASALQFQTNIVGTVGGRLTVIGPDGNIAEDATKAFRQWAKHAEFTRGMHLNELLQLLLVQLTHVGGDFIAVLDADGELTHADEPSYKLKIFETDQIRNVCESEFLKAYPASAGKFYQIHGIVKDSWDRVVGAFVGNSRKSDEFAAGEYLHLKLDTPGDFTHSNWIQVGNFDRANQTRGISPVTHLANSLSDLATLQGTELSAAKLNSSFGLVISDKDTAVAEDYASREYAQAYDAAVADGKTEDEAQALAIAHAQNARTAADKLLEGQSAILSLQPNKKIDSFKTERPNLNVIELYDRLKTECGTVLGIPQMYMNLKPQGSYSAARAEMVLFRPIMAKWRKALERDFLDWLADRVLKALGFNVSLLGYMWSWPAIEEVDEGSAQTALQKKFANCETNLVDIHGADTDKFIERRAIETAKCHAAGILAPWETTVSGAQVAAPDDDNSSTQKS